MKIDRLFGILSVLLERDRVQAKELARRFEVSERTIYRDIAALETAGMPVVTYAGTGGGIGILPGYTVDKRLLSRKDLAAISAGLQGLSSISGDRAVTDLVTKLMPENAAALSLENDIVIDFSSWDSSNFLLRRIADLRDAISQRRCIEIDYVSQNGRSRRWIEPYKIVFKASSWYLYAFCRSRHGFRLFKLSRMMDVGPLGDTFTPTPLSSLSLEWDEDFQRDEGERIVLRFPPRQEYLVMDMFGPQGYDTAPDGDIIATFHSSDPVSAMNLVLAFGGDVRIVEGDSLKAILLDWAKNMIALYQT